MVVERLCCDLQRFVNGYLECRDICRLECSGSRKIDEMLYIRELINFPKLAKNKLIPDMIKNSSLTEDVIKQKKYINLVKLDLSYGLEITDINHLVKLKTLIITYGCKINGSGFKDCLLIENLNMLW